MDMLACRQGPARTSIGKEKKSGDEQYTKKGNKITMVSFMEVGAMKLTRTLDYTVIRKYNIMYITVCTLELEILEHLFHFWIDFTSRGIKQAKRFFRFED